MNDIYYDHICMACSHRILECSCTEPRIGLEVAQQTSTDGVTISQVIPYVPMFRIAEDRNRVNP